MAHADKKGTTVPLNLRIDPTLKKRFKVWCAQNDREMTDVLVELIQAMLSDKPAKPPRRGEK